MPLFINHQCISIGYWSWLSSHRSIWHELKWTINNQQSTINTHASLVLLISPLSPQKSSGNIQQDWKKVKTNISFSKPYYHVGDRPEWIQTRLKTSQNFKNFEFCSLLGDTVNGIELLSVIHWSCHHCFSFWHIIDKLAEQDHSYWLEFVNSMYLCVRKL